MVKNPQPVAVGEIDHSESIIEHKAGHAGEGLQSPWARRIAQIEQPDKLPWGIAGHLLNRRHTLSLRPVRPSCDTQAGPDHLQCLVLAVRVLQILGRTSAARARQAAEGATSRGSHRSLHRHSRPVENRKSRWKIDSRRECHQRVGALEFLSTEYELAFAPRRTDTRLALTTVPRTNRSAAYPAEPRRAEGSCSRLLHRTPFACET
jgi:hypothetical protein